MKPNGELKIEHGIPVPKRRGRTGSGRVQIALRALRKGDSVVLPTKYPHNAYAQAKKYVGPNKYVVRRVEGGFRVWRIK